MWFYSSSQASLDSSKDCIKDLASKISSDSIIVPLTLLTLAVIRAFLFFFSKYLSFTTLSDCLDRFVKAENAPDEVPAELLPN